MRDGKMFNYLLNTTKQVRAWAFFAASVPIVALGVVWFVYMIGWTSLLNKLIIVGAVAFFGVAVFWWWWAIFQIALLSIMLLRANDKFTEVSRDLEEIKKDLNSID